MSVILSKDGIYYVNDAKRGRKRFKRGTYFILDNAWQMLKQRGRPGTKPSFLEFQKHCAETAIAGYFYLPNSTIPVPTTFPDESLRSLYNRLCNNPNEIMREAFGPSGKCAPLSDYRDYPEEVYYMSKSEKRSIKSRLDRAKVKIGIQRRQQTQ